MSHSAKNAAAQVSWQHHGATLIAVDIDLVPGVTSLLTLGLSNTGEAGQGLAVYQPGLHCSCRLQVLRAALQVGSIPITINLQLESLPVGYRISL